MPAWNSCPPLLAPQTPFPAHVRSRRLGPWRRRRRSASSWSKCASAWARMTLSAHTSSAKRSPPAASMAANSRYVNIVCYVGIAGEAAARSHSVVCSIAGEAKLPVRYHSVLCRYSWRAASLFSAIRPLRLVRGFVSHCPLRLPLLHAPGGEAPVLQAYD